MSFGFPAYFTESRIFHLRHDTLVDAVKSTLNSLGWRYELLSANELQAKVSINPWSWGEKLKVEISANCEMSVESRCAYPLQWFDWGKNRDNVKAFYTRLEQVKEACALSEANEKSLPAFDERGLRPVGRMFDDSKEN